MAKMGNLSLASSPLTDLDIIPFTCLVGKVWLLQLIVMYILSDGEWKSCKTPQQIIIYCINPSQI